MTKEEEARFDPRDLVDLRGSTAAKSRKMSTQQRDIMLHKRRLRNRASAARSRHKQRKTITELAQQVDVLLDSSDRVRTRCDKVEQQLADLVVAHDSLRAEHQQVKASNTHLSTLNSDLRHNQHAYAQSPRMRRTASTLRLSLSTDMLDKIISGNTDTLLPAPSDSSSAMLRIPSKLHLSLSTDKLSDGLVPTISSSFPPMSRNVSIMERLLDYANNNYNNSNNNTSTSNHPNNSTINFDGILINTDIQLQEEEQ